MIVLALVVVRDTVESPSELVVLAMSVISFNYGQIKKNVTSGI